MKLRIGCSAIAVVAAGLGWQAAAHAESAAVVATGPSFFASDDNEGFRTRRYGAELFPAQKDDGNSLGLRYRHHEFSQNDWSRNGEQLAVAGKGPLQNGVRAWQGEAGLMRQGGHDLLTLDGSYNIALSKDANAELFINRDFVETRAALDQGVHFTFVGGSLEYRLHPKLTAVAVAGYQDFSDDNQRKHARLRLIYQPDLDLGLTLQYRYRYYDSSPNETRRAYFNPERYRENMLLAGWRKRYEGWVGAVLAGAGIQSISGTPDGPSRLLELALDSPAKAGQVFGMRAGYLRTAAFGGPDYRYRYIQGNWTLRF
jgi:hypothetical protein